MKRGLLAITAALGLAAAPTNAQETARTLATIGTGAHVQTFSFGSGADVSTARLFLVPLAAQAALGARTVVDGYTAFGSGTVRAGKETFGLRGPVDSWARVRWSASPRAVLAIGASLPTGLESHTAAQAVVSNVLSDEMLGFREGSWGAGGSLTVGVSTTHAMGASVLSTGASYRSVGAFDPSRDTTVRYAPGNEMRARVGLGMDVREGHLETGLTVQSYSVDRLDQKNLFQSGARIRSDLSYSRGAWSLHAADLWRTSGELTTPVVNVLDGKVLRDTVTTVGWQNVILVGFSARVPLAGGYAIEPVVEAKSRQRADFEGRGWMTSVGASMPMTVFGIDMFPQVKVSKGSLTSPSSPNPYSVWGAEMSVVARGAWVRSR